MLVALRRAGLQGSCRKAGPRASGPTHIHVFPGPPQLRRVAQCRLVAILGFVHRPPGLLTRNVRGVPAAGCGAQRVATLAHQHHVVAGHHAAAHVACLRHVWQWLPSARGRAHELTSLVGTQHSGPTSSLAGPHHRGQGHLHSDDVSARPRIGCGGVEPRPPRLPRHRHTQVAAIRAAAPRLGQPVKCGRQAARGRAGACGGAGFAGAVSFLRPRRC